MNFLAALEAEIGEWPLVSVHPHRFGGQEFRCGQAEIGHIHSNGVVDIPFPRSVHDALLEEGLAEQHHWAPDSGWITFRIKKSAQDIPHALWLMRLSYLRYALKGSSEPQKLLDQQAEELHLNARFKALMQKFMPSGRAAAKSQNHLLTNAGRAENHAPD